MKKLERKINERYQIIDERNTRERENATSVRNTIVASLSGVAAIGGAVGSFIIAGPSGLRLFASALASGVGGGGVGAALNAILPAHWINSDSFVGRSARFITSNLNVLENLWGNPRNRAIANGTRPRNTTAPSANSTNTANPPNNDPLARVWNGAKSTVINMLNSILHYRFRRNQA